MTNSHARSCNNWSWKPLITLWLCAGVCAPICAAQQEQSSGLTRYAAPSRYPDQYRAATELAEQLGAQAADPETLYQLSRLLSDPCDQLVWLDEQLSSRGRFGTDSATREAAERVLARLQELEPDGAGRLRGCQERLTGLRELLTRIARPPTPWEIDEPALLAETWRSLDPRRNPDLQRELTPARRLLLNARGIAASELDLTGTESWNVPRKVVEILAARIELPPMARLIQLHDALEGARADETTWETVDFPVQETYVVARALLDRALGIDALDYPGAAAAPHWTASAEKFESEGCWTWAALARLLEAADGRDGGIALAAADEQWAKARQVAETLQSSLWPAVAGAPGTWLQRLTEDSALNRAGQLPLSADYRAARRAARRTYEDGFLAARNNPEEAFRYIQLAKAADIGRDPSNFQPATIAQIEADTQVIKSGQVVSLKMFALVETIAIQRPNRPIEYYAVLINISGWTWLSTTYEKRVVGPFGSPAELIRTSFDEKYKQLRDLRLLIALDGPLDEAWFEFERENLLPYANYATSGGKGWLIYLPSLAFYQPGNGALEEALRHFFLASRSSGGTLGVYTNRLARTLDEELTPRNIPDLLDRAPSFNFELYALNLGVFPDSLNTQRPAGFISRLCRDRAGRSASPPAFLVWARSASN